MENSGNGASMIARNARKWKENGNRVGEIRTLAHLVWKSSELTTAPPITLKRSSLISLSHFLLPLSLD